MPQITPQHAHVSFGPKGTSEEPVGMQALQPLAIEPIGFRSAGGALRLAGINQQDLQTNAPPRARTKASSRHRWMPWRRWSRHSQ